MCSLSKVSALVAMGAVAFGYQLGISSPLSSLKDNLPGVFNSDLSLFSSIMLVSYQVLILTSKIGAGVGSICSGAMADFLGRKYTILLNAIPFTLGSILMYFASSNAVLIVGRVAAGFSAGVPLLHSPHRLLCQASPP